MLLLRPRAKRAPWYYSPAVTLFLFATLLLPAGAQAGIEAGEPQLGIEKAIPGNQRSQARRSPLPSRHEVLSALLECGRYIQPSGRFRTAGAFGGDPLPQ